MNVNHLFTNWVSFGSEHTAINFYFQIDDQGRFLDLNILRMRDVVTVGGVHASSLLSGTGLEPSVFGERLSLT